MLRNKKLELFRVKYFSINSECNERIQNDVLQDYHPNL